MLRCNWLVVRGLLLWCLVIRPVYSLQFANGIGVATTLLQHRQGTRCSSATETPNSPSNTALISSNAPPNQLFEEADGQEQLSLFRQQTLSGDPQFLAALTRLRSQLYQVPQSWARQFNTVLNMGARQPPLTGSEPRHIRWRPVRCKVLGLQLRRLRALQDDGPDHNSVWLMIDKVQGNYYVQKNFHRSRDYAAELAFLTVAGGLPHIVKPICYDDSESRSRRKEARVPYLILEYVEGGTSDEWVQPERGATNADLVNWSAQLLVTLSLMHRLGFVHGDLKPGNVLIRASDQKIVLIDFGFTLPLDPSWGIKKGHHHNRGNPIIRSPEIGLLTDAAVHEGGDWWAYGATVLAWWTRRHNYRPPTLTKISNHRRWQVHDVPPLSIMFPALRQLLYVMTDPDSERRRFNKPATLAFLQKLDYFNER